MLLRHTNFCIQQCRLFLIPASVCASSFHPFTGASRWNPILLVLLLHHRVLIPYNGRVWLSLLLALERIAGYTSLST